MTLQHVYAILLNQMSVHGNMMDTNHILIGTKYFNIRADLEGLQSELHGTLISPKIVHVAMSHVAGTKVTRAMSAYDLGLFVLEMQELQDLLPETIRDRCKLSIEPQFRAHSLQAITLKVEHVHDLTLPVLHSDTLELVKLFCDTATAALNFAENHEL